MSFSINPETCYACLELEDELSKLRSMIRAIGALPTAFGIAGDFDTESWIKKSELDAILTDSEYK